MKTCCKCKVPQSLDQFTKDKSQKDGLRARCKTCISTSVKELVDSGYYRDRYLVDGDKIRAKARLNQPNVREKKRLYRKRNPEKAKMYKLKHLGIVYSEGVPLTVAQYKIEIENCGNNCMICSKSAEDNRKSLAIDHDHETGLYRGLLCASCNIALGLVNDNTLILKRMISYLNNSKNGL